MAKSRNAAYNAMYGFIKAIPHKYCRPICKRAAAKAEAALCAVLPGNSAVRKD